MSVAVDGRAAALQRSRDTKQRVHQGRENWSIEGDLVKPQFREGSQPAQLRGNRPCEARVLGIKRPA